MSLPSVICAAARCALEIQRDGPSILTKIKENIKYFAIGLRELGYKIPLDHRSTIFFSRSRSKSND